MEAHAAARLDRLLDLRFEQLKKDVLVDARDLEILREELDSRRVLLESLPALWPVRGILSSGFGVRISPFTDTPVFHHGLDIIGGKGLPVRAAAAGKVVRSGYESLFGNVVVLEHGYGYRTLYAHLETRRAEVGDVVEKGDPVGTLGETGRTTGPHLHYEVHVNGLAVNPSRFLR
jgi:murein DD-endopeptidase MepM/ murein hydrolase activator NlpD